MSIWHLLAHEKRKPEPVSSERRNQNPQSQTCFMVLILKLLWATVDCFSLQDSACEQCNMTLAIMDCNLQVLASAQVNVFYICHLWVMTLGCSIDCANTIVHYGLRTRGGEGMYQWFSIIIFLLLIFLNFNFFFHFVHVSMWALSSFF